MQAVARLLGVDRSALNHHVKGREHLLQLVAQANFSEGFVDIDLPADADWRAASRAFAWAYADALEVVGPLASHVPDLGEETRFLRAAETVLRRLSAAGFQDEFAVRFLVALGYAARGFARDRAEVAAGNEVRRPEHTQVALDLLGHDAFPHLDRVSRDPFDTYGKSQLDFVLDVLFEGARAAQLTD